MGKFREIPIALRKQIFLRLSAALLFLLIFIIVLICTHDVYFSIPCIVISVYFFVHTLIILFICTRGTYIILKGVCTEIKKTKLRHRIKSIEISSHQNIFKILIREARRIQIGDTVILYLSDNTQLFNDNECYIVCKYYAMEVKKNQQENKKD